MTHFPMTAPAPTSNFAKKDRHPSYQQLPIGMHPAIIYSLVNIGTQEDEFQGKKKLINKLKITYEFPAHKQLFWVDDVVPRPSVITQDFTYSISKNGKTGKKSALLIMIESLFGPIAEKDYLTFDLSHLLDMKVFVQMVPYQKKDGTTGIKVGGVSPLNTNYINPAEIIRTNELVIYNVQMGFNTEYFAKLQYYDRMNLKDSVEGKAHAASGGVFVKYDENKNIIIDDGSSSGVSAPTAPTRKLVYTNTQYSYDALKGGGWTDDAMVQNGYAHWEAIVQQAPPAPVIPTMPANLATSNHIPVAPIQQPIVPLTQVQATPVIPVVPIVPQIPVIPQGLQMTALAAGNTYEAMKAGGWTDELLVQNGYALAPAPVIPPLPAVPVAPVLPPVPPTPVAPIMPVVPVQPLPAPPMDPATLFSTSVAAPVQQVAPIAPVQPLPPATPVIPQAPITGFESAPAPNTFTITDDTPDDLPF